MEVNIKEGKNVKKVENKEKKEEGAEEFFENRVLKPLPDYSFNPELRELAATLQREIIVQNPNVRFPDIVGLKGAKSLVKEAVLLPLKYPHFFTGLLEPWKGILLFGPPGTGKTMLAKAVATECKTTFFNISASSIVSKWRGDSEKLVRLLFELARHHQPSTIFLDEIDSIMGQRNSEGEHEASRRMKTELLIQLDGLVKNGEKVFLLAASNLPWELDSALLRRLEKRVLVPMPSIEAREQMLRQFLPENKTKDFNYTEFSQKLEGYSGSDIRLVCKEAAMKPLRRLMKLIEFSDDEEEDNQTKAGAQSTAKKREVTWKVSDPNKTPEPGPVTREDFIESVKNTKPSYAIGSDKYEAWLKEYGSL